MSLKRRGYSRLLQLLLIIILGTGTILFVTPFLIIYTLTRIPRTIGATVSIGEHFYSFVDWAFGVDQLQKSRDEIVRIYAPHAELDENLDRWSLLRQIEQARTEREENLRDGEFVLALFGAGISILSGIFINLSVASVIAAIVLLAVSTAVLFRIVIVDVLSYDEQLHALEDVERLTLIKGWNCGPMQGRGAIFMAAMALLNSKYPDSYNIGVSLLDEILSEQSGKSHYYSEPARRAERESKQSREPPEEGKAHEIPDSNQVVE